MYQDVSSDKLKSIEEEIIKIVYANKELKVLFRQIEKDMKEFIIDPLKRRIQELTPEIAEGFCNAWSLYFSDGVQ